MLYDYQQQLNEARDRDKEKRQQARETFRRMNTGKNKGQGAQSARDAAAIAAAATPWGFFSLILHANIITDWMYGLAIFVALFKDFILDPTGLGSLPAIGTVITFCVTIFIVFMTILGGFMNNIGGRKQYRQQQALRSWLVLIGGTGAEMIFGINFLPIETVSILLVYSFVLIERKRALAEERERNRHMQGQEAYA
jgi:hypothetical protein